MSAGERTPGVAPELLVPAGGPQTLKVAVHYGADAVYLGGRSFGLRAKADNFSDSEIEEAIRFCHARGVRVYVTVNIFAHQRDLEGLHGYLQQLREWRPDGLIIADPGVFLMAKELCPQIPLHISTQANNTNSETCRFWAGQGASRIVTARELSLEEIRAIRSSVPEIEIESFVHGAMCISYSGRCLLSNVLNGRDANQGSCTHPCRWKYALAEESRPGEYFPVEEDERGSYIFNSKDLCMIEHIPDLIAAGIDSFKIEGRMKTALYVATVTRAYRMAIDWALADPETYLSRLDWLRKEVGSNTNRQFTTGFYYGRPTAEDQIYGTSTYVTDRVYIGTVESIDDRGRIVIGQKNKFAVGDILELVKPDGNTPRFLVRGISNAEGQEMPDAPHAKEELHLDLVPEDSKEECNMPQEGDVLRAASSR